jgi:cyclic beta-1,2-glucan synthetase
VNPNQPAVADDGSIPLLSAAEQGTFNVGSAHAASERATDPEVGGDLVELKYTIPPGTAAGIYAKAFPADLSPNQIDIARLAIKAGTPDQAGQITAAVEIKGTAGLQRVPVEIRSDWKHVEDVIDWPAIGTVREVVLLVNGTSDHLSATGTILVDVRFEKLDWLRKLSLTTGPKFAGVLLASLLAAMLTMLPRWARGSRPGDASFKPETLAVQAPATEPASSRLLLGDVVRGAGVVLVAWLVIETFLLGSRSALEAGWTALGLAIGGAVVAEYWKIGLTGRHLTTLEAFQDALATGLLATSSSSLAILQAPTSWSEVVLLSQTVAAVTVLVYHAANAYSIASSGKHLGAFAAALIVGTPYAVGSLVLLESAGLMRSLGNGLALGVLEAHPAIVEFLGRVFIVFCFNVAVAQGLGLATKGALLLSARAQLSFLGVATAAVAAFWIAALGSGATVADWPMIERLAAVVFATILSQAGLWAEAYLVTGMLMDAVHGQAPSGESAILHPIIGMKKGMVYSGVFMGSLYILGLLWQMPLLRWLAEGYPLIAAVLLGASFFPLIKTIVETFDGSPPFFRRLARNYLDPMLSLRGIVVGLGMGSGLALGLPEKELSTRACFGFVVGALTYAGIDILRDSLEASRRRGRVQALPYYVAHALLGGFVGVAIGFYLDSVQVGVVAAKFHRYLAVGLPPELFEIYPLVSKWGHLTLGTVTGGASLLLMEALAGVISWSTASWLFAINRTFMRAYFWKDATQIRSLFTSEGMVQLGENMIQVLRWGLWMSPIINSFLRPMAEPTWYNQDGAIRTVIATFHDLLTPRDAFRAWSLLVFINLLAYDSVRILIWLDHMGLRVATLVNLSFLGTDALERWLARLIAPAATARCIPEGVKRFTTWGPLLIPFYIPRGRDWDQAWSAAESIRSHARGGLFATLIAQPLGEKLLVAAGAVAVLTAFFSSIRWLRGRCLSPSPTSLSLTHSEYQVTLREDGEVVSRKPGKDFDLSRRSYDWLDPAGRALFVVEAPPDATLPARAWPIVGNVPNELATSSRFEGDADSLKVTNLTSVFRTTVEISLPEQSDAAELWTITVENLSDSVRSLKVVPYLEWVLNRPEADRGHTQYNRLFAEIEYASALQAVLAWDRHAKAMGVLVSDRAPEGFLSSRIDFIGRAGSLRRPRALSTLAFSKAVDTPPHPTMDPIGSLLVSLNISARGSSRVRLLIGLVHDRDQAVNLIARHFQAGSAGPRSVTRPQDGALQIQHGEIPPSVTQPYAEFAEDGRKLVVHTPFTPRPFDHSMSNVLGHVTVVTNRGLHTSSSVNSQQNRLTPDWADIVTRELPGEAMYLYDPDRSEWYSPTYHPLNDAGSVHEAEFGVDGTAKFRMVRGPIETELAVFVPPHEPVGVYLLTIKNRASSARKLRFAAYFQIVLAGQPEYSGPLRISRDPSLPALFFENPRNTYRTGPAFAAISERPLLMETRRGRFFGTGRSLAHPLLVERGEADAAAILDDRPVAALVTVLEIPAHAEHTVVVILGQADERKQAEAVVAKYQDVGTARASLEETRRWWLGLMGTLQVETNQPRFDGYLNWLKYQALAERIWARRGFYQASGAYGFRDQLQDSVNLMWMDPAVARRQILLHASQQFIEGDVVHWFHRLQDGRTGFVGRTHASDNLLWLAWGVVEYVGATGDESLLEEMTPYLEAEQPFEPLPKGKQGIGFDPLRSPREDTVYRHCMRAIDLVLDQRMGARGLPLMGTGDWNDGLDEIGSQGKGESVWLGFFLYYILERLTRGIVEKQDRPGRLGYYRRRLGALKDAIEQTWRGDRYLRAIHDDGTEIGVKGSGVWEIDALTAAWAVMSGINPERGQIVFETALRILEKEKTVLLGWPPLRADNKPYLGRSSVYPEGVRENGMYCHGVQWLVGAARILAEQSDRQGNEEKARHYSETAQRLWLKISPIPHTESGEIETYGGQPNKQAADMVTTFDPGRMIWNGYTGAAGWMFRQALEGVLGLRLQAGQIVRAHTPRPGFNGELGLIGISRDTTCSPLEQPGGQPTAAPRSPNGSAG